MRNLLLLTKYLNAVKFTYSGMQLFMNISACAKNTLSGGVFLSELIYFGGKNHMKHFLFLSTLFLLVTASRSQSCGTCSINITTLDSGTYVVSAGEILCLDSTGNFIGTITLNGGTVCNKGLFYPKSISFNSGTINNFGNLKFTTIVLSSGRILNNKADGVASFGTDLILSGGSFSNEGITNVGNGISNNTGDFFNAGVLNCVHMNGSNAVSNSGIINTN
jgi:hypothetical protein